jgi:hypothetical protein
LLQPVKGHFQSFKRVVEEKNYSITGFPCFSQSREEDSLISIKLLPEQANHDIYMNILDYPGQKGKIAIGI